MLSKIRTLIETHECFLVAAHLNPDGDAIASTLALGHALKEMGKQVVVYNGDPLPDVYAFLPGSGRLIQHLDDMRFDVGFVLDSGELRRAGEHLRNHCGTLVNIDHHTGSEHFTDYFWVDPNASSTGTMIYRLLKDWHSTRLSRSVAVCIYTALISDTGSFRYSNTDRESFSIAADLLESGVDPAEVASCLYENREEKVLRLLTRVLDTLKVSPCGRIASIAVTQEHMKATATGPEHTDGFINYPRSIHGVEIALLFREAEAGHVKVGMRSNGQVDVACIARSYGGGGHVKAAGATLNGSLEDVAQTVTGHLAEVIA